jgi:hypothetical protein
MTQKQQSNSKQNAEAVEALAPETRQVEAGGKVYEIRRLETRQVWPTLRAGLPILEGLVALTGSPASSPAADSPPGQQQPAGGQPPEASNLAKLLGPEIASFLELMAQHGERITEIVAIGLDEKVSTVGKFEPQETYLVLKALIEVNRDFFSHRVAPLLGLKAGQPIQSALAGAVGQALRSATTGDGATPSSN